MTAGDDIKIFLGLLGKFGKYFFVWLDLREHLSRDFWGYSKQFEDSIHGSARVSRPCSSANKVQPNLFCGRLNI